MGGLVSRSRQHGLADQQNKERQRRAQYGDTAAKQHQGRTQRRPHKKGYPDAQKQVDLETGVRFPPQP